MDNGARAQLTAHQAFSGVSAMGTARKPQLRNVAKKAAQANPLGPSTHHSGGTIALPLPSSLDVVADDARAPPAGRHRTRVRIVSAQNGGISPFEQEMT